MDQGTAQAVINKQAMTIAQLSLDKTLLEVELEQAKAQAQKLQQGTQRGTGEAAGDE